MGIHSRKLPVPRRFYKPSHVFSKLGLSRGRNLKEHLLIVAIVHIVMPSFQFS